MVVIIPRTLLGQGDIPSLLGRVLLEVAGDLLDCFVQGDQNKRIVSLSERLSVVSLLDDPDIKNIPERREGLSDLVFGGVSEDTADIELGDPWRLHVVVREVRVPVRI